MLIGTPLGAPALVGLSCSAEGMAVRATISKRADCPLLRVVLAHSTAPALSTWSPTTVSSKTGPASSAARTTRYQTSLGSRLPKASAWYLNHGGEAPPSTSTNPPELPVSA